MEELIGKGIDNAFQLVNQRRIAKSIGGAIPFETEDEIGRFKAVASMIAGKELRIVALRGDVSPRPYRPILHKMGHQPLLPEHGFGWSNGETLFLPYSIVDMQLASEQEELATLLIFFLSAQIRWGSLSFASSNRNLLVQERPLPDIFWIVENRRLLHVLCQEFQGLRRKWENVIPHLLEKRPKGNHLNKAELRVEELLQKALTSLSKEETLPASPEESFNLAKGIIIKWAEEGVPVRRYRGMVPFTPWGRLVADRIKADDFAEVSEEDAKESAAGKGSTDDDGETRNRYLAKREKVDEENNDSGLALNIYDKMLTWGNFLNLHRPFDDDPDDDNVKKADEMEELSIARITKGSDSLLDADLEKEESVTIPAKSDAKVGKEVFLYPEWDYRSASYRKESVTLTEKESEEGKGDFVSKLINEKRGLIKEVRRKFEALAPASKMVRRQPEGDDIDIDAAVEALVDLDLGRQPDDCLFITNKREEREISALFLIDLSMSTETWVNGQPVIDHEREAIVILCEAMRALRERYAIYGFSGKTRKNCTFYDIKGFEEEYSEKIKGRIEGLTSYYYTRMGVAIRHATALLKEEPSEIKLLFLISDGKPNDLDEYEGRYGIEDTRMAVIEAERAGIVPFCLTVDSKASEYLPRLFGKGNYTILSEVNMLSKVLPELYGKIIRQL